MIVGSSLTIEIGDRTLLRDASFVVGAGEKVGLVGRNGTGKSTFISVIIDEPGRNVRSICRPDGWTGSTTPPRPTAATSSCRAVDRSGLTRGRDRSGALVGAGVLPGVGQWRWLITPGHPGSAPGDRPGRTPVIPLL